MKQISMQYDYITFRGELIPLSYKERDDVSREDLLKALNEFASYKPKMVKALLILAISLIGLILLNITRF